MVAGWDGLQPRMGCSPEYILGCSLELVGLQPARREQARHARLLSQHPTVHLTLELAVHYSVQSVSHPPTPPSGPSRRAGRLLRAHRRRRHGGAAPGRGGDRALDADERGARS